MRANGALRVPNAPLNMLTLVSAASVLPSFVASSIALAQAESASSSAGASQAATQASINAATETAQVVATTTTPTGDAINLALMAGPMLLCFELGVLAVWFTERRRKAQGGAGAAA